MMHNRPTHNTAIAVAVFCACSTPVLSLWVIDNPLPFVAGFVGLLCIAVFAMIQRFRPTLAGLVKLLIVLTMPLINFPLRVGPVSLAIHELIAIAYLVFHISYRSGRLNLGRITIIDWSAAVFLLAVILAISFSQNISRSIFWSRGMLGFLCVFLVWRSTPQDIHGIEIGLPIAGTFASAWGLTQALCAVMLLPIPKHPDAILYGVTTGNGVMMPMVTGPFLNPDFLALFVVLALPLTIHLWLKQERRSSGRFIWLLCSGTQVLAILLTGSTGAYLGLALSILATPVIAKRYFSGFRARTGIIALVVAPILFLTLGSILPEAMTASFQHVYRSIVSPLSDGSTVTRLEIWRSAINVWSARPILGAGINESSYMISSIQGSAASSHSLFFSVLADMGLVGLLALILQYCALWNSLRRLSRQAHIWSFAAVAFCGYLFVSLTTGSYVFDNIQTIIWALLGASSCQLAYLRKANGGDNRATKDGPASGRLAGRGN